MKAEVLNRIPKNAAPHPLSSEGLIPMQVKGKDSGAEKSTGFAVPTTQELRGRADVQALGALTGGDIFDPNLKLAGSITTSSEVAQKGTGYQGWCPQV